LYAPVKERRSLTQARQPAPISITGHAQVGAELARALDVGDADARMYTHGFHSYPARLHPITARRLIKYTLGEGGKRVLDPFCGSGTVLVEAVRAGIGGFGVDANPLAVAIAQAKTWAVKPARRRELVARAGKIAERAIAEGKAARRSGYTPATASRPMTGPEAEEWFAPHVRKELETLAALVAAERDLEIAAKLRALLSSILVKVSRRTSDTSGKRVERKVGRGMAARLFAERAGELTRGLDALWKDAPPSTPAATIVIGDARKLPASITDVDAIVSSPPYAGTYDYVEHHKLRLDFLGIADASFTDAEIGARRRFAGGPDVVAAALTAWERDMRAALAEMKRVLRPRGRIALVVGDSLAGKPPHARAVFADEAIARLAPAVGLEVVAAASIRRQPLGRAEGEAFATRPKQEHIVCVE
jgi:DNA modification methylase